MPLTKLSHLASSNLDAVSGSLFGAISALGITTGAITVPDGVPSWVGWLGTLGVALAPIAVKQLIVWRHGEAAGDRIRAARKRAKADRCRKAGNEAEAVKLEDKADELDAEAAEKEAKARGGVE